MPGQTYELALSSAITSTTGRALTPFSWRVRTSLVVDQTSPAVKEVWDRDANTAASGGSYASSRTAGARTTFTFSGTSLIVLGMRSTAGGLADVHLDGVLQTSTTPVSFYAASTQWQVPVWSRTGLTSGTHTVRITPRGTRATGSTDAYVNVDAFQVGTTLHQESASSVTHRWARVTATGATGGSYDTTSLACDPAGSPAPQLSTTFRGTKVVLYGTRTPSSGRAAISIDGGTPVTVDLYAATAAQHATVFTSPLLVDGIHTIRVTVLGTKQTASTGTEVGVDSLQLT